MMPCRNDLIMENDRVPGRLDGVAAADAVVIPQRASHKDVSYRIAKEKKGLRTGSISREQTLNTANRRERERDGDFHGSSQQIHTQNTDLQQTHTLVQKRVMHLLIVNLPVPPPLSSSQSLLKRGWKKKY